MSCMLAHRSDAGAAQTDDGTAREREKHKEREREREREREKEMDGARERGKRSERASDGRIQTARAIETEHARELQRAAPSG